MVYGAGSAEERLGNAINQLSQVDKNKITSIGTKVGRLFYEKIEKQPKPKQQEDKEQEDDDGEEENLIKPALKGFQSIEPIIESYMCQ